MITKDNYFEKVKGINRAALPEDMQEEYDFVKDITENHTTWEYYKADPAIKDTVNDYFKSLSDHIGALHSGTAKKKEEKQDLSEKAREAAKDLIRHSVHRGDSEQSIRQGQMGSSNGKSWVMIKGNKIQVLEIDGKKVGYSFTLHSIYNEVAAEKGNKPKPEVKHTTNAAASHKKTNPKRETAKANHSAGNEPKLVERIDEEVRFIKRYALMNGKWKLKEQLLVFINSLQKAILEKRIRKTSPYKKEIEYIQNNLLRVYNSMGKNVKKKLVEIDKNVLSKFLTIGGSEKIRLSVTYLKRYIGIQGKTLTKEKVQRLHDLMKNAIKQGKISKNDPYVDRLNTAFDSMYEFLSVAKPNDKLEVHENVLNGINDALEGCSCEREHELNGFENEPMQQKHTVMNSMDFSKLKFDSLGFTGKWYALMGDPCAGFSAMVFGKPKMGKSYLCVDFAGYLAREHGDTLYVAREEKLDATLQQKLVEKKVSHPSLYVSDHLPKDLTPYEFIFLDSVNKLGLSPQDLERLKLENPGKSFIDIHQTTKDGKFRGTNEYQHDVDVVIEVPERGKAVQFGRFNQGGEMQIFDDQEYKMVA